MSRKEPTRGTLQRPITTHQPGRAPLIDPIAHASTCNSKKSRFIPRTDLICSDGRTRILLAADRSSPHFAAPFPPRSAFHLRAISTHATHCFLEDLNFFHSTQINFSNAPPALLPDLMRKIDNDVLVLHSPPMAKPALGRGLGALMGGGSGKPPATTSTSFAPANAAPAPANPTGEQVQRIPVTRIVPCSFQPRKDFTEESIKELADSIKEQGILQPLIVRAKNGSYELIAGERRWRAAQIAGLTELPVLVREADDRKVLELALIENLQRENLNPIEEALGYSKLIKDFSLTQEEAAVKVGKNRATVANLLRILQLHPDIQNYIRSGLLTFGHGRAVLGITSPDSQKQVAEEVIREGLSVRETEQLVNRRNQQSGATKNNGGLATKPPFTPDVHIGALQTRLQERFGTKVLLRYRKGKGAVEIRFFNDDDLDRVLEVIGVKID